MPTPLKVLIVEADNTSANKIKEFIENEGYGVVSVATNGMVALQALNANSFDLAIVDYGLPNSWSDTVMHALGKKEHAARVVVMGQPNATGNQHLKSKFPDALFLSRPFSQTDLLNAAAQAAQEHPQ